MPQPLSPPPASDYGALTIPRTLQRWLDDNPVSRLTRAQYYINLPPFSVQGNWVGVPDIIAAFNVECSNNFTLPLSAAAVNTLQGRNVTLVAGETPQQGTVIGAEGGGAIS